MLPTTVDPNTALYVGVDVHRYTHTAVAANRFEEVTGELTFPNTLEGIGEFVAWTKRIVHCATPRIIGIEGSNGHGKLLRDTLLPLYPEVYEINPVYTKQRRDHGTRGDKSDVIDAKLIIEVLVKKLHELPKITRQDQSEAIRCLEELTIFHDDLTRTQTRLKNQLHQLFHQEDPLYRQKLVSLFSQKALTHWRMRLAKKALIDKEAIRRLILVEKLKEFQRTQKTRKMIDGRIKAYLAETNNQLVTMPGVGITTAAKIMVATKGIGRFNVDQFVSYAGIAPVEKQSRKTRKHKQAKCGNRQLNTAIYMIALTQLRCHPKAKAYFQKKIAEGKTKKHAIRCLMKRIACIVYGVMKSGERYRGA